jgi:hypothetical protein
MGVGCVPGDSSFGVSAGFSATSAAVGEYGTYLKSFPFDLSVEWPKITKPFKILCKKR